LTGFGTDLTAPPSTGQQVTFTASGTSCNGGAVYYGFYLIPNYGTDNYDPDNNWSVIQAFSTDNTCTHTFTESGNYVVVVFASAATSIPFGATPIFGGAIAVGINDSTVITGLSLSPTRTIQVGDSVTFSADAVNSSGGETYYRFHLIPDYGTDNYDPNNNWELMQDLSTNNTCTYTFTETGDYIVVVFAAATTSIPATAAPIMGGSVRVK
jgi:plastocyanin